MNELLELAAIAERTLRLKERWADLSDAGRARLAAMVALAESIIRRDEDKQETGL